MKTKKFTSGSEEVDAYLSKRKNPLATYFRGDVFFSNLEKLKDSEQALKNLELFRERTCELKLDSVSYRTLHHWDSINLIECERESSTGWRRFNLAEVLWVHVITKMREMGISLEKVAQAKPFFFEKIPHNDLKYIEYYVVAALYFKTPAFFVTIPDGQSEFLSYTEMTSAMCFNWITDGLFIHLNPLMNKIFQKIEIESKFPIERPVTLEQNELCNIMNKEDFDSLKITKAKGKISNVEIEKGFTRHVPYNEIAKNETEAIISTRISDGVVASRKRVKRIKLD